MTDNSFVDAIRANPIPTAMIGIGAAWLYFKRRSESGNGYSSSRNDSPSAPPYRRGMYGVGGTAESYAVGTRGGGTYAGGADAGYDDAVGGMGRDLSSRTREMAEEVRDTARQTTRRAQLKFNDVLQDNPLMLGAAAALIGAAVGMSIPATEAENELMGEARDAVVDRAQNLASDAANQVSEAASNVQQTAGRVADAASNVASTTPTDSSSAAQTGAAGRRRSPGDGASQS